MRTACKKDHFKPSFSRQKRPPGVAQRSGAKSGAKRLDFSSNQHASRSNQARPNVFTLKAISVSASRQPLNPRNIQKFIEALNTQTSRGIPVGPAASIVFAEAVMIDLDRKVLATTRDYVRWVDDFRIFFRTHADARQFLHQFTEYIHDNHRLVLSGEKTRIIPVEKYRSEE